MNLNPLFYADELHGELKQRKAPKSASDMGKSTVALKTKGKTSSRVMIDSDEDMDESKGTDEQMILTIDDLDVDADTVFPIFDDTAPGEGEIEVEGKDENEETGQTETRKDGADEDQIAAVEEEDDLVDEDNDYEQNYFDAGDDYLDEDDDGGGGGDYYD